MKKMFLMTLLIGCCYGCGGTSSSIASETGLPLKGTVDNPNVHFFPKSEEGYVGDPIPYFDGEKMNVFFLLKEDSPSAVGFHPWSLLQTTDFAHYEDQGVVIPYERSVSSQDLALGTGSVIKDNAGLYHAFYTGYNGTGNMDYFEKIQHATSSDLIHWTKLPEDGFYGGQNDFRDPHVLYMENEGLYWMLVTTRDNAVGVIKLYKSSNLSDWTYYSIFFRNDSGTYNMECPTLVRYGNFWYLSYSEQGSFRVTHYRYRASLDSGSWLKPATDYLDGRGVYAGKMEKAFDQLYFIGWQAQKQFDYDGGDFDWGGNIVTHQMQQLPSGELIAGPVERSLEQINHPVTYPIVKTSSGLSSQGGNVSFTDSGNYNYALYDTLEAKSTLLSFSLDVYSYSGNFGLTFGVRNSAVVGSTNIVFDVDNQRLCFYNVTPDDFATVDPQASIPLSIGNGSHLEVTLTSEEECLSVYVADQCVLSVRMYEKTDRLFGWFANGTTFSVTNATFKE